MIEQLKSRAHSLPPIISLVAIVTCVAVSGVLMGTGIWLIVHSLPVREVVVVRRDPDHFTSDKQVRLRIVRPVGSECNRSAREWVLPNRHHLFEEIELDNTRRLLWVLP